MPAVRVWAVTLVLLVLAPVVRVTDTLPEWIVEVDWTRSGAWVDISTTVVDGETVGRVRDVSWQRGKNDDAGRFEAGTATIVLDNRDRALEPDFDGSPWYPNVKPSRPIRIRARWDPDADPVFTGYIESLPPSWDASGSESSATIVASDRFIALAGRRLPASVYEVVILADTPRAWWRLGEQGGTEAGDSSGNGHHGTYSNSPTFGSVGAIAGDADTAIEFGAFAAPNDEVDAARFAAPLDAGVTGTDDFSVEFWMYGDALSSKTLFHQGVTDGSSLSGSRWRFRRTGDVLSGGPPWNVWRSYEFRVYDASGASTAATYSFWIGSHSDLDNPPRSVLGERWNHFVETRSGTTVKLYVNGALVASTTGAAVRNVAAGYITIPDGHVDPVDELAVYDQALDATQVADHYAAGTTPWEGDTTGERIVKLLELAGLTAADYDVDPGRSTMRSAVLGGMVLDALRVVEEAEDGWFYFTADGVARFRDRDAIYDDPRSTEVQAVFGDRWDDLDEVAYTSVDVAFAVDDIVNSVRVTNGVNLSATVEDADSIDEFGVRSSELTAPVLNAIDLEDRAGWRVASNSQPALKFRSVTIAPALDPERWWPIALSLDIGDRVAFRKHPPGGGDPVDVDAIVIGKSGSSPAGSATITFTLGPVPLVPFALADDVDGSGPGEGWSEGATVGGAWTF